MELEYIAILSLVALVAGFFDAIAGGGGLITLPSILLAGVDPVAAIATNKVQASCGSVSATISFSRQGLVDWKKSRFLIALGFLGGVTGASFVSYINKSYLEVIVPILLILVAIYFICAPSLSHQEQKEKVSVFAFSFSVAPLLGFYDGIFGPGIGSFFMIGFILLCGMNMMTAMGFTKVANASCNLGSLTVFIIKGAIIWPLALSMSVCAFIGAQLGAKCAVKVGPKLIKPMIVSICTLLTIKMLSNPQNYLHQQFVSLFM